MPAADIRSFFGGKVDSANAAKGTSNEKDVQKSTPKKSSRGKRKVVSDDEEDEPIQKKPSIDRTQLKKTKNAPKDEEVTTSDYFLSKKKTKSDSTPMKSKSKQQHPAIEKNFTPSKPTATKGTPRSKAKNDGNNDSPTQPPSNQSLRVSSRQKKDKNYQELRESEDEKLLQENKDDSGEDIFGAEYKSGTKALDNYESDSEEVEITKETKTTKRGRKRKSSVLSDDGEEKKPKSSKSTPKKARKPAKSEPVVEDAGIQKIFDDIPMVRAPTPPTQNGNKKFNYAAHASHSQPAPNAGSKEIPEGAENCLVGLTFVFTGILDALGRDEGQGLVKRYGGKVTTAPSSKTSYVVLGSDAGPKKLETIKKFSLKTINEDGLFALIRTLPAHGGSGQAASKANEKREAEEKKFREEAARQEEALAAEAKAKATSPSKAGKEARSRQARPNDQLWTVKYAPAQLNQICGNKTQVERLQTWLRDWQKNAKANFKKGGPVGSGFYRAVIIHGNPGIGKTTAAHLVAKLEGYDIVESNASDTRSKKLIETGLKGVLDTTSLLGYFAADGQKTESAKKRLVLIMDEVDGMSAGDRGGVGAMAAICKKTSVPIILICNDRRQPKMKPFDRVTFDMPFRKPTTDQVRSRIMTVLFREGIKGVPQNVVNALIEGSGADIRRVINMISTARLDEESMNYDEGKKMTNAWEKNIILKPWDITQKILGGGLFASSSKATINEKAELYFNDHEFSYLMLQENYLHTHPILAGPFQGRKKELKTLDLVDKAAASISDGDLFDSMIHGAQQHWSLMPAHAIFSFVLPASFVSGSTVGNGVQFTSWLGNNSKQMKLTRCVKEIQGHMRLRASGDRHEIRQQYLPLLWTKLVKALELHGSDSECIEEVINLMDSYFITKEDWDSILELGVGPQDAEKVTLSSQVKSNFTRKYNAASHPLPFMKAGTGMPATKVGKVKPDLEEAIDESEDDALVEPAVDDEDEALDLKKDKYVQAPKKRKAASKKSGKATKDVEAEESGGDSDEPPSKKAKTKGKGATKATRSRGKK